MDKRGAVRSWKLKCEDGGGGGEPRLWRRTTQLGGSHQTKTDPDTQRLLG